MTRIAREFVISAILDDRAARFSDRTLMRIDGVDISFSEIRDRSVAAANLLRGLGVSSGETVAIFSGSTPEWVYFWLGAARIGVRTAAVNAANKGDYLRHALDLSAARVVVVDTAERAERVREVRGDLPVLDTVLMSADAFDAEVSTEDFGAVAGFHPDDAAALFFTSGTTGPSKAVATSWRYLLTAAETVSTAWDFREGETIWSAMPLFHLSAVATVLAPLLVGGTTVLESSFSPSAVRGGVRASGAVGFVGAGAMVSMLLRLPVDDDPTGLRFTSAAPIAAEHFGEIERRYGCRLVTMYGLTEAFPIAVKAVGDDGVPGSSGRVNPDIDVVADDGEIICRPTRPGVMSLGYVDAGTRAVRPHDEWFRTGDLGRLDDGVLTYIDRVKDAIRRRGENVSSVEVENVVAGHPAVAEAAAVGVPSDLGEEDVLVVVVAADADLDAGDLLDFCADRMPYFCVPRYIRFVDVLPRNVVGRVRKDVLRAEGLGSDTWDREAHGHDVRR